MFRKIYDYKQDKKHIDSLVDIHIPGLYEQCLPMMTKIVEEVWLSNYSMASYREFNQSKFATNLYKIHLYNSFKNGWKEGFFSLGQVINFKALLEEEFDQLIGLFADDLGEQYSIDVYAGLAIVIESAYEIGKKSGALTPVN